MEVRSELKYSNEHEWVQVDGDEVTIGISDFAQHQLGDVVYVELPEVGTMVDAGESIGNIESVKAVSEIYCPLSGEVIAVNKDLEEEPEIVNSEPYDGGWMIKLRIDPGELSGADLMDADAYQDFTQN